MEEETEDFAAMRKMAALTIAGSDSGGNAGVQADLRAFQTFGVHGCTVFTALTAQNPFGVSDVLLPEPAFVTKQLRAVMDVYDIQALKTGMLAAPEIIEAVADVLEAYARIPKIIDPVMVATSGARLLEPDAVETLKKRLLPLAFLITPNLPEAEALSGMPCETLEGMQTVAKALCEKYGCAVLVKGGHNKTRAADDVLFDGNRMFKLSTPVVTAPISTHGTGCSLSAAITAAAACGKPLLEAVTAGKAYVYEAIRTAMRVSDACAVMGTPKRIPTELVKVEEMKQ
jgi:hydroxymethylpyrimidine/phosphomethylpyrimidine kinase